MRGFNDANAALDGFGNFTLGLGGANDGRGDATHPYAKNDVFINIPLASLLVAPGATGAYVVPTFGGARAANSTAGARGHQLALGTAATSYRVLIPISGLFRTFQGNTGQNAPHGFKLTSLAFYYTAGSVDLTAAPSVIAWTVSLSDNLAPGSVDGAAYGGTVTYENPIGTAVGTLPVTQRANLYGARAVFGTPAFVNTADQQLFAELTLATGASSGTASIYSMIARGSLALY